MIERDKINVIISNLEDTGSNDLGKELQRIYDALVADAAKSYTRVNNCRDYLMQVQPDNITVEDTLVALGYNENGH